MTAKVSLTNFLTYTAKVSTSAKIAYVRKIKNDTDYSVGKDYWRDLRNAIKRTLKNQLPIESLIDIVPTVRADRQKNYSKDIRKFIFFYKHHEISFFETGRAKWELPGELIVSASPELGLQIDGVKYLVKNYYKVSDKNTKVTKRNINSTLLLMDEAQYDFNPGPCKKAVLNLQNGVLIPQQKRTKGDLLQLEIDARSFADTWNRL
ncbi:hypothetical protein [Loigolactobacillus coryniformis]|uniref:hypothetical protein n=1 Tax=Loigolactobacillus coryniformis TaxID=1610 RepID=UPI001C5D2515|nr:hypothetical protein [Loigolactobacillus coryniformis]MBW4803764.1 hypothetical protein [Loigolactobacillus coryniformis subsp. torquens]MBW4806466.1 hypothetical protein [Loigolactobacillus coryniformis subsp. torquens]